MLSLILASLDGRKTYLGIAVGILAALDAGLAQAFGHPVLPGGIEQALIYVSGLMTALGAAHKFAKLTAAIAAMAEAYQEIRAALPVGTPQAPNG